MNKKFNNILEVIKKAESFGFREVKSNGAKLYGHVPHVAPEAWFHNIFPPLKEDEIEILEEKIKNTFPENFKNFLKKTNGLSIFSTQLEIYGYRKNFSRNLENTWQPFDLTTPNIDERPDNAKPHYFSIGSYFQDGSLLFIDKSDNKVYRSDRDDASILYNVWPDFWEMLLSETLRLETLFDSTGHLLDKSKKKTPTPNL